MLQSTRKNPTLILLMAAVIVLSITCLIIIQTALAQDTTRNQTMRQLLETLNTRIEREAPFQVMFKFAQPVTESGSLSWEIPSISQETDISRWIGDIGDDFICFYEHTGDFNLAHCTPFSNIVSVNYIDN